MRKHGTRMRKRRAALLPTVIPAIAARDIGPGCESVLGPDVVHEGGVSVWLDIEPGSWDVDGVDPDGWLGEGPEGGDDMIVLLYVGCGFWNLKDPDG